MLTLIMKNFISFLFFVLIYLLTEDSEAREVLNQIQKAKPTIDIEKANKIAHYIDKYSKEYRVPASVMTAIAMVESSYRVKAVNYHSNDYGIFQINDYNIEAYKFNKNLLLTDTSYSVEAGFIVFSWFYKRYPLDEAIMRFNGGTAKKAINKKPVKKYLKKVKSYM